MKKSKEMVETISHLMSMQPFFAVYLFDLMTIVEDNTLPYIAATDGASIFVNPGQFNPLPLSERVFIVCHEILHGIYQHMPRIYGYEDRGFGPDLKPFQPEKYNIAADYVINDVLVNANIGKCPSFAYHDLNYGKDWLVDDVYSALPDQPKDKKRQGDGHFRPSKKQPTKSDVQRAVAAARSAAKAMDKMPGTLEQLVGDIIEPALNWKALLRSMVTASSGTDQSTWAKPNRRRLAVAPHIYMPGTTGFSLGGVAIVVDTSGSISNEEFTQFMSEVASILSECTPEWCKVLWTDAQVAGVDEVDDVNDIPNLKAKGGGGTDMSAAFTYMNENGISPEICVVLTDGYTPWGDAQPYRVVWGITTENKKADHGESIHINVK